MPEYDYRNIVYSYLSTPLGWNDFFGYALGNEAYAGLLIERCIDNPEPIHPATLISEDLKYGEVINFNGNYVLTGGRDHIVETAHQLWTELGDVPIDDDECIEEAWYGFPAGTWREDIWHFFEDEVDWNGEDVSVADLMMGIEYVQAEKLANKLFEFTEEWLPYYVYREFGFPLDEEKVSAAIADDTKLIQVGDLSEIIELVEETAATLALEGSDWKKRINAEADQFLAELKAYTMKYDTKGKVFFMAQENEVATDNQQQGKWVNFKFFNSQVELKSGISQSGNEYRLAECRFMPGSMAGNIDLGNNDGSAGRMTVFLSQKAYHAAQEQKANGEQINISIDPYQYEHLKDGKIPVEFYDKDTKESYSLNIDAFIATSANKAGKDTFIASKEAAKAEQAKATPLAEKAGQVKASSPEHEALEATGMDSQER